MTWFTETPWPPMIVLAVAAAGFLAAFVSSRRGRDAMLAVLLLIACAGVYVVEQQIVTERERVEAAIHGVAEAFEAADTGATLEFFSANALEMRAAAAFVMEVLQIRVNGNLRITDVDVELTNNETRARTHFRANGLITSGQHGDLGHQPTRWMVTWQKEGGEWRIINVQRLDPVRGDPIDIL